ncbi:GNAT family N-acetyltransferase [Sphingobacterium sp. DK4209]|uniref:GNAT family N-acetyltransferase n=1 Tax=Sphingobacterium zhuxiongii TaxID=2662364 RepID=A0A5Q0QGL3_9SPHI|nr:MULTISPECIES: GNAT family protein [unclassified Sphingobacterium]MVZ66618.1 GNAT family N-acetyltransferase [Sphingobacterium sp. DK4209]QGA26802.1 GNAT family N-acetyltransferase [Sphingobacterium sp. dk4302]
MIQIEAFEVEDFDRLIGWVNSAELLTQFAGSKFTYPLDRNQLQSYILEPNRHIFKVLDSSTDQVIGHAEIYELSDQVALICRVLIGESALRGQGKGTELMKELLAYAYDKLAVHTIDLNVYDWNLAAISCYQKLGFEFVSDTEQLTTVNGDVWRSVRMRILPKS